MVVMNKIATTSTVTCNHTSLGAVTSNSHIILQWIYYPKINNSFSLQDSVHGRTNTLHYNGVTSETFLLVSRFKVLFLPQLTHSITTERLCKDFY